jgi:hypothetical protein
VGARPADGRSVSVRSDGRARPPASRAPAGSGPLVARRDLDASAAYRTPDPRYAGREPRGRVRRFVHRYGWRAYAVPLLTVATVVTLGDLAANGAGAQPTPVAAT